jgi:hypothetical protein
MLGATTVLSVAGSAAVGAVPLDAAGVAALDISPSTVVSTDAPGDSRGLTVLSTSMHGFPSQGSTALVLSTGDASIVAGAPDGGVIDSTELDDPGGADGNDITQLYIELVPPGGATCIAFDFLFLSEEYPDYVGSVYNDIFTAELNESLFSIEGNQVIAPNNFAFASDGSPVSVNTLFGFTDASESQLNGRSPALSAASPVEVDINTGRMTLILSVQDLGDSVFDSAVVVDNLRWLYGAGCGSPVVTIEDSDGDGLSDAWETEGIDYDNDGVPELDLPAMGADPNHKDLFIEVDWMYQAPTCVWFICWGERDFSPQRAALDDVVAAFANSPLTNPDGTTGVRVHIDSGSNSVMNPTTGATWGSASRAGSVTHDESLGAFDAGGLYDWSEFEAIKSANFDFERRDAFHYVVYANTYGGSGSSGISRGIPGSDLIVSDGHSGWNGGFSLIQERGTFMHELGHNMDLYHGGGPTGTSNYAPAYQSIMNYAYQLVGIGAGQTLDYSRGAPYDDWANIRFDGGSVGDLGDSAPAPTATVSDSLDAETARNQDVYAMDGDALLTAVGPTVIVAGVDNQSLAVDIANLGSTNESFEVTADLTWLSAPPAVGIGGGDTARALFAVGAAPIGTHTVEFQVRSGGVLRSTASLDVTVVDLSDPAAAAAAQDAVEQLAELPDGLDPDIAAAVIDAINTATDTPDIVSLAPRRFFESRAGEATFDGLARPGRRIAAGETVRVQVTGRGGVPAGTAGVVANVTAVFPSAPGFVTVWDCVGDPPVASSLNYGPGDVVPNEVIAKLSPGGELCLFTLGETDLLVDVAGLIPD